MPIATSPEFQATVQGQSMAVAARLTLTLPVVGSYAFSQVALVSVSGLGTQMQTDVPDGVRVQAGYYTIGGQFTLAGPLDPTVPASLTIADLLDPDNAASPMYRQSAKGSAVLFEIGVRPPGLAMQWVPKLTGRVSSYTYDVDDGSVTLSATDLSADWSGLPVLRPGPSAPQNAGLTSEYVMDTIARNASDDAVSSWPPVRPLARLAVGLRTSLEPALGNLIVSSTTTPLWSASGPWGSGLVGSSGTEPTWIFPGIGDDAYVEVLVAGLSGGNNFHWHLMNGAGDEEEFLVTIGATSQTVTYSRWTNSSHSVLVATGTFSFSQTINSSAHIIGVALHMAAGSASWTATLRVDGVSTASGARTASGSRIGTWTEARLGASGAVVAGLQVTTETTATSSYPFTPLAILDPSLNPLDIPPAIDTSGSAVSELQTVAGAELGYIRRDELGVLRFTNRNNLANQALGRDISSRTSLKTGLQAAVGAFAEYQRVQIDYTGWKFGKRQNVFTLDAVWKVDGHTTQTFTVTTDDVITDLDGTAVLLSDGADPADGGTYYRASFDAAGLHGITDDSLPLAITVGQTAPNVLAVTIRNPNAAVWMITSSDYLDIDAGTPSLWIGGKPVTPRTVTLDLGDPAGTPLQMTGNQYRQDRDTTIEVASYVLNDLHAARVDYTGISIVPDPTIQTGDLVTLKDPDVSGLNTPALIWGWTFDATFGDSPTWDMTVSARALGPPGAWLLDYPGRSELGDGAGVDGTAYLY